MIVRIQLTGDEELRRRIERNVSSARENMEKFLRMALITVAGYTKENWLSGPRPVKIGVVTGRLRSSIGNPSAQGVLRLQWHENQLQGFVGTRVVAGTGVPYGVVLAQRKYDFMERGLRDYQHSRALDEHVEWLRRRLLEL